MGKRLSRAERNIRWIEEFCRVPEAKDIGKPVRLRQWQRDELVKIYDNPAVTRQAIISFPRKNGKTALIAWLLLLHLCGPEARPNSQLYSAATSRDQAATVFKLAVKTIRQNPDLSDVIIIRDTAKELLCPELGTFYAALSADNKTAHGKSPVFAVHDELGQVRGPVSDLYDAVETGMGAHEDPLSIVISTQAPTDADLLSRLIDDALSSRDPQTVVSVYSAPMGADPFSVETLKACNPAWGDFLNPKEPLRKMQEAKALASQEPSYRNLHLNQRVTSNDPFIPVGVWKANGGPTQPFDGRDVWGGLDLAQRGDMSALVWVADGDKLDVEPHFWLPAKGLRERVHTDKAPLDVWARDGHLHTSPGATVNYRDIARQIMAARAKWNVRSIAFDPNMAEALWPLLEDEGMTEEEREALFWKVPQSYAGMSPCLGELQALCLDEKMRHGMHPVLNWHAINAVLHRGKASDQFIIKKPSDTARIDGMVALAMAVGRRAMMMQVSPQYVTGELIAL